jgi:nucleoside-diphosphate-sugar epimerase
MKTACVLGGNGMIGMKLVSRLKQEGYWVRSVDIKEPEFEKSKADEVFIKDLRDKESVSQSLFSPFQKNVKEGGFDEVYMLAAQMGGAFFCFTGVNDADIIHDSAIMNIHVADISSRIGVKKLFFSSSACCYSERLQEDLGNGGLKENGAWDGKPDSVYGIEKLISEQVYDSYRRNKGLNVRIARFHNIFSTESTYMGDRPKAPAAICRKVAECPDGGEIEIFGDGIQERSFLWIDECLDAVRKLMDSEYYQPLNIGSDYLIGINELAKMVIDISGKNITIKNIPSNAIGVRSRCSDNTLIKEVLGWQPTQPLRTGMEKLYSWINQQVNK